MCVCVCETTVVRAPSVRVCVCPFRSLFCTASTALSATSAAPSQPAGRFTDSTRHAIGPRIPTLVGSDQLRLPLRRLQRKDCLGKENKRVATGKTPVRPPANQLSFPVIRVLVFPGSSVRQHFSSAGRPENVFYVFCSTIKQLQ